MMMMMTISPQVISWIKKIDTSYTLSSDSEDTTNGHLSSNGFMRLATDRKNPNKKFNNHANVLTF